MAGTRGMSRKATRPKTLPDRIKAGNRKGILINAKQNLAMATDNLAMIKFKEELRKKWKIK